MHNHFSFQVFPQLPAGTSRHFLDNGFIPVDPAAPLCEPGPEPDGSWRLDEVEVASRFVSRLSMRVPRYLTAPDVPGHPDNAEDEGGILLALWRAESIGRKTSDFYAPSVAVWVGPEPGYPTVGGEITSVQTSATECQYADSNGRTHVVRYTLRSSYGVNAHVAAVRPLGNGRFLTFDASAPDEQFAERDGWTMLATLRATPR